MNQKAGLYYALGGYIIWGLFPIYWKLLDDVNSLEILLSRIIWSFIFTFIFVLILKQHKLLWQDIRFLWRHKSILLTLFIASIVVSINWFTYIWAVNHDFILETSLAYYINPLISVLFGILFFKERLSKATMIAVIIAAIGVGYITLSSGTVPYAALIMATSFAIYGALKKQIKLDATRGLVIETFLILPFAVAIYIYMMFTTDTALLQINLKTDILLLGSGIVTAVPLVLFAKGAQMIPLYVMGIMQFLQPTIVFFLGVYMFKEPFTTIELITFACIWLAIIIFSTAKLAEMRRKRKQAVTS